VKAPNLSEVLVFGSRDELRAWFEEHHDTKSDAWFGYYRKGVPKQSVTYPEAVDEALCFGWIDGITFRIDDEVHANRFTPRRKGSNWSAKNVQRVTELLAEGRMQPAGLAAFEARRPERTGVYSYENRPRDLPPEYLEPLQVNPEAWAFWQAQTPTYRRAATWWVVSAKQESTRQRRLDALISDSAAGRQLRQLAIGRGERENA
jgi:uncharacterized protein YdeI (YjbR/CyaY-like superfamily)